MKICSSALYRRADARITRLLDNERWHLPASHKAFWIIQGYCLFQTLAILFKYEPEIQLNIPYSDEIIKGFMASVNHGAGIALWWVVYRFFPWLDRLEPDDRCKLGLIVLAACFIIGMTTTINKIYLHWEYIPEGQKVRREPGHPLWLETSIAPRSGNNPGIQWYTPDKPKSSE